MPTHPKKCDGHQHYGIVQGATSPLRKKHDRLGNTAIIQRTEWVLENIRIAVLEDAEVFADELDKSEKWKDLYDHVGIEDVVIGLN